MTKQAHWVFQGMNLEVLVGHGGGQWVPWAPLPLSYVDTQKVTTHTEFHEYQCEKLNLEEKLLAGSGCLSLGPVLQWLLP